MGAVSLWTRVITCFLCLLSTLTCYILFLSMQQPIRCVWGLPFQTHGILLPLLSQCLPVLRGTHTGCSACRLRHAGRAARNRIKICWIFDFCRAAHERMRPIEKVCECTWHVCLYLPHSLTKLKTVYTYHLMKLIIRISLCKSKLRFQTWLAFHSHITCHD